jgi:hypothetical protein
MVEKELGIPLEPETVKTVEGLTMGLSYVIGSVFPLIAYFFLSVTQRIVRVAAADLHRAPDRGVDQGQVGADEFTAQHRGNRGGRHPLSRRRLPLGSVVPRLLGLTG